MFEAYAIGVYAETREPPRQVPGPTADAANVADDGGFGHIETKL